MLQPFLAMQSDLLHIMFAKFDALGKGNSWEFGLLPLALSPRTETQTKQDVDYFLTADFSWLPSLLGSKTNPYLFTSLCSVYLICLTGRAEDLGALGKAARKKDAFGPEVSGKVLLANDLFQKLCKP